MGIWSWRLAGSKTEAIVCSVVAILSVVAVPLFCYRYVYYQTNLSNILWAELPLYYITESHDTYYIPYYLLALFFVILAVTYRKEDGRGKMDDGRWKREEGRWKKVYYWMGQGDGRWQMEEVLVSGESRRYSSVIGRQCLCFLDEG